MLLHYNAKTQRHVLPNHKHSRIRKFTTSGSLARHCTMRFLDFSIVTKQLRKKNQNEAQVRTFFAASDRDLTSSSSDKPIWALRQTALDSASVIPTWSLQPRKNTTQHASLFLRTKHDWKSLSQWQQTRVLKD